MESKSLLPLLVLCVMLPWDEQKLERFNLMPVLRYVDLQHKI